MWPPGHLAFGYLLLVALDSDREYRSRAAVPTLLLATQVPDLVDKPLSWWLAVLPSRSLGHSLLVAALVLPLTTLLLRRVGRPRLAVPFALGSLSHLLADCLRPIWTGRSADLGFLLWPLARRPPHEMIGLANYLELMALSPYSLLQVALVLAALAVWRRGGIRRPSDR